MSVEVWGFRNLSVGEETTSGRDPQCSFPRCDRRKVARGLCTAHYKQMRAGQELRHIPPPAREMILDLLDIDPGWWTSDAIAVRLGRKEPTVEQALARLRREGLAESRLVELNGRGSGRKVQAQRVEWRLTG